jgi:DNA modification methylase
MNDLLTRYQSFLKAKVKLAGEHGFDVSDDEINAICKPHQRDTIRWMVRKGRCANFSSFGLGKTVVQLEVVRLTLKKLAELGNHGRGLIVLPLGVRQEFMRDAAMLGTTVKFIRRIGEAGDTGIYLTNYETIRDQKMDPRQFIVASLDEASCLRGFGGTKTFREFMATFAGDRKTLNERTASDEVQYRFVATATPSPNDYIELLAYAAFLGVSDVSQGKTRFFKRDSTKADKLTLHKHKEHEFWLWVSSWGLFVQKPSDLGHPDEGYQLPEMEIHWHEIPDDHENAGHNFYGQGLLFKEQALGVVESAREKRDSLPKRIEKMLELRNLDPSAHRLIWHDLEAERKAIDKAIPGISSVYGSQDLDRREQSIIDFSNGAIQELAAKPVIAGSGCNFQRHCSWAIFLGIGFKFNDFIQAIHRIHRFLQTGKVRIDLIYTESEREIRRILEDKWQKHIITVQNMTRIINEYGLSDAAMMDHLHRAMGVARVEVSGEKFKIVNHDSVVETAAMPDNSVDLILTSVPFSTQYEYSPNFADFGHTDHNAHFFEQMDFLTPNLLRVLKPGRLAAIHVKDRIVPGGLTGLGFQTVYPFHCKCVEHYQKHGFYYMGMATIVTDVVRENNQTYRLGWSEVCKDGTKIGFGMPEYLLLFRKVPTDTSNAYADEPVTKLKPDCLDNEGSIIPHKRGGRELQGTGYSRARWQVDAHDFWRSSGNRMMTPEELQSLPHTTMFRWFRDYHLENIYDYEQHVRIGESIDGHGRLPVTFMLLQPPSWNPDVWTDVARMRTLNMLQERKGQEMHLCLAIGSLVLTKNQGYIPIENVTNNDYVLTHKGRWRKVLVSHSTGVQPVVQVKAHGVPGIMLTPDHKLWTRTVRDIPWAESHSKTDACKRDPEWIESKNTVGSYVNLKLPPIEDASVQDHAYWFVVGRWIADGHISGRNDSYVISCGKHRITELVNNLGVYGGNSLNDTGSSVQITLKDKDFKLRDTLSLCGRGASNKRIPPNAYTLPPEYAKSLLDGYLSGDGHYHENRSRFMATTVSKTLALGLSMLAQRAYGSIASVYLGRKAGTTVIEERTVNTKQEYIVSFDIQIKERAKGSPFILDDGAWKKVRSCDESSEIETWNLRVEEDESYTAEGCIVKNCPLQFDIIDRVVERFTNPGETVYDPFGGIMSVPYRAIKKGRKAIAVELSPRYFLDGAAYCKAAEQEHAMPDLIALMEAENAENDIPDMEAA